MVFHVVSGTYALLYGVYGMFATAYVHRSLRYNLLQWFERVSFGRG